MTYTTKQIHAAIRAEAFQVWEDNVHDFDDSDYILAMFHACGWTWIEHYRNNEKFAWCGIFAGFCASRVGHHIDPAARCVPVSVQFEIIQKIFPSTQRLGSWARWDAIGTRPKLWSSELDGRVQDFLIPGAIVTIGTRKYGDRRDYVGGHIVIVDKYDAESGDLFTIEGNAHGLRGDGSQGEGVIRRVRNVNNVKRVYLLDDSHLDYLGSDNVTS